MKARNKLKIQQVEDKFDGKRVIGLRNELAEMIRAALDCPSHIYKPTIINNDPNLSFGDNPIVICEQCVERMRKVIGLSPDENIPSHLQFWNP